MGATDDRPSADRAELVRLLAGLDAFRGVEPGELDQLAAGAVFDALEPEDVLVEQGEPGRSMYILLAGAMRVELTDAGGTHELARLGPGSFIGEIAVVAGGRRSATVRAITDCRVAEFGFHRFNALLETEPNAAAALAQLASRRLREQQLASQLRKLMPQLDDDSTRSLMSRIEWHALAAGDTLFEQGDPGDGAFLVVSGRLAAITRTTTGASRTVGEVGSGELVGEYALIMDQPRGATVVARKDSDLAHIPTEVFLELVHNRSDILLELTRTIIRRTTTPQGRVRRTSRSVAIVQLDDATRESGFTDALFRELSHHGDTLRLDARTVERELDMPGIASAGDNDPGHIRLRHWLSRVESAHPCVLYETDAGYTGWTSRAIRNADEVLFIADAAGSTALRPIETELARRREAPGQRRALVLRHDPSTEMPRGTSAWLRERSVDDVYHVRRGDPNDLARLGRLTAGRALSVVLGAGGARGFAHLGVLRALEELGLPVDRIGGCSIGAPIAALAAQGHRATEVTARAELAFANLMDYTLPLVSLLRGERMSRSIERYAQGLDLEDLWIPCFCLSTNMTTAREVVHRTGSIARAVRASVSIPGIFPPVPFDGDLLVDGAVLNNIPIDVMRRLNPDGPLIAIDVGPPRGPRAKQDYGMSVSGWSVAARKLNPMRRPRGTPAMTGTVMRSMLVGGERSRLEHQAQGLADLYLQMKLAKVGLLDFGRVREIADIGHTQALPLIQQWIRSDASPFSYAPPE